MIARFAKSLDFSRRRAPAPLGRPAHANDNRPRMPARHGRLACRWQPNPATGKLECRWALDGGAEDPAQRRRTLSRSDRTSQAVQRGSTVGTVAGRIFS